MTELYCTTIDNTETTRASGIYANADKADARCMMQNDKAAMLGIKTRYQVTPCDESWLAQSGANKEQVIQ